MTKRALTFFLAVLMIIATPVFAFAEGSSDDSGDGDMSRFTYINSTTSDLSISGLTADCYAKLTSKSSCSLKIKMELQKYSSGSYSTVQTWTTSKTGTSLSLSKSKIINPLSTYRLKVTFTAASESTTVYSYS